MYMISESAFKEIANKIFDDAEILKNNKDAIGLERKPSKVVNKKQCC